ncbi:RES domain-containing protein [Frondihabitans sp. Leaf304]|uniref:RES domain-containing protein n=1 Tax=Frondihabitans sp. Leaf304 TaxID=1736329 RepID=UPI0006F54A41|nr:RES domain-containing protein [Frondihabitans sp. Leaf304]KQQ28614.1 hypothetical protein ASF54_08180 [Frondihabitans sp. Leaf304]
MFDDDYERGWGDIEGAICEEHITDPFLSEAAGPATELDCVVCGRHEPADSQPFAVAWGNILDPFMAAFWREYTRAADAPRYDRGPVGLESTDWAVMYMTENAFTHLEQIIPLITGAIVDDEVGTVGALMTSDHLDHAWMTFSHAVRHETRFVFTAEEGPAARVREFLELVGQYATEKNDLISDLPPTASLFRARTVIGPVFPGRKDLPTTAAVLGPAPAEIAGANRMSPVGIPMFYGASNEITALHEVAAYSTAEHAVVGVFHPTRPLRMLNLESPTTESAVSPFDEEELALRGLLMFFKDFQNHISAPITPDGRQHIEYVPTQILAEYFRHAVTPRLDGIIFTSSHGTGTNYVVFADQDNVADDDSRDTGAFTTPLFDLGESEILLVLARQTLVLRKLTHRVETAPVATLEYGNWRQDVEHP